MVVLVIRNFLILKNFICAVFHSGGRHFETVHTDGRVRRRAVFNKEDEKSKSDKSDESEDEDLDGDDSDDDSDDEDDEFEKEENDYDSDKMNKAKLQKQNEGKVAFHLLDVFYFRNDLPFNSFVH